VDDELAALKGKLSGASSAGSLPAGSDAVQPVQVSEVDPELEELKRSIDKL
jgi:phage shock protein A